MTNTQSITKKAHHAAAKSYLDILAHFDSRINGPLPESVFDEQTIITRPIIHKDDMIPSSGKVELLPVEKPRMAQFDQDGNVFVPSRCFDSSLLIFMCGKRS